MPAEALAIGRRMSNLRSIIRHLVPPSLLLLRRRLQSSADLGRSIGRLRKLPATADAHTAYRIAQAWRGFGEFARIDALQDEAEICMLMDFLRDRNVRMAAEIGSFRGGTLFMMSRVLPADAAIFSIDLPGGDPLLQVDQARRHLHEAFATRQQEVKVLYGDSRARDVINTFEQLLNGRRLDFLFIDGDHSLEGVMADFENYTPFVKPGGFVGFHDIVPHAQIVRGVHEFWLRSKASYQWHEFVAEGGRERASGGGIGVLQLV
jgi:predicted O-methyltransferase YrrM